MPAREPWTVARVLCNAIGAHCVAALVIPIIALFVSGIRRRREESEKDVNPVHPSAPAAVDEKWRGLADDR